MAAALVFNVSRVTVLLSLGGRMNAYLHPATAASLLAQSRAWTEAKRAERETAKRQAAEFDDALAQLIRLQWPEDAARELASLKVYGVMR